MTIRRLILGLAGMFAGWIAVLVAVGLASDAAPAYVVPLPPDALISRLDPDVSVMAAGRFSITLTSDTPGLARRLYGAGAILVLPAGLPGCLPLPEGHSPLSRT
ncbi:hypothetical protein FQV27_14165 [Paracoccus aurantiacus]|uniref:Uncharacterized protein n=1 Tax=Paracoccus aurantiacus TaxID=2599412 RepID=A0A5C6RYQ8_9RHOB|nr:hypothetical protein [Paracoccus aurantiacus]TXB67746.1 hypothetical protein FQV27_14165 [Paracoccus aurantiacus]